MFAHGLSQGIGETRPLGSGVQGRKVFMHFRGHGRSSAPPGPWTYLDLARDLRAVADLTGATRALGVSPRRGCARAAARRQPHPVRAGGDLPAGRAGRARARRGRAVRGAARRRRGAGPGRAGRGDLAGGAGARCGPPRPAGRTCGSGSSRSSTSGWRPELASLAEEAPLPSSAAVGALRAVTAEALVIGCHGDDVHPAEVAAELADALPKAELHLYDKPHVMWNERADVRDADRGFPQRRVTPWVSRITAVPTGSTCSTRRCASGTAPCCAVRPGDRHRARPLGVLPGRRRPAAGPRRAAVAGRADPHRRHPQGRRPVPDPGRGRPAAAGRHGGDRRGRGRAAHAAHAHPLGAARAVRRGVPRLRRAGDRRQHGAGRGPDGLQPARGAGGLQDAAGGAGQRRGGRRPAGRRAGAARATRRWRCRTSSAPSRT